MAAGFSCFIFSCTPVPAYRQQYLRDSNMQLSAFPEEKGEISAENYREGAAGGNGGKTGGGCGCN